MADIDVATQKEMIASAVPYVDVRTAKEYGEEHVKGAIFVPMHVHENGAMVARPESEFLNDIAEKVPDKSTKFIVACRSGARSKKACGVLTAAGYTNVQNAVGGFMAWKEANGETEK